jgi:hypothetical protein
MKQRVFADFNDLSDYPEAGIVQGIPLGLEEDIPELRQLHEHEVVILEMPGELQADGYVTRREMPQGHYWYGVVTGRVLYANEVDVEQQQEAMS